MLKSCKGSILALITDKHISYKGRWDMNKSVCDQRTDPKRELEAAIITNEEDSGNIMAVRSQVGVCGLVL